MYFRCFTLRVRPEPPIPAGATNGIRLLLYRGNNSSPPELLVREEDPELLQSIYEPYDKAVNREEALKGQFAQDGFYMVLHEPGTFPNFPPQTLPNGISLNFGETMRIALEMTDHTAVHFKQRPCINDETELTIKLVKFDSGAESNAAISGKGIKP
ncbi:unnamed protein product [Protopolystoma xenopodis]|uniref:Uncharacterized protein n=1 Tax=Protopolystoma xenopodis TaxID=117903 RepID=A0A448WFX8_9PLAT|nr:unnamed protein product [Protopolystoma xenopodis]